MRATRLRRWASWVVLGVLLGIWAFVSPGSVFILVLVCATTWRLSTIRDAGRRRWTIGLFLAGFAVRAVLSLGLDGAAWLLHRGDPILWLRDSGITIVEDRTRGYLGTGDSDYYSDRAYQIALYAEGVRVPLTSAALYRESSPFGWSGYLYVLGLFHYAFGFSPYAAKLLTCWLGALVGPLYYLLADACFNAPIARLSGIVITFFPSLVMWSATNLKDTPFILLTVVLLVMGMRMPRPGARGWVRAAVLFCVILIIHVSMRHEMFSLSLVACLAAARWLTSRVRARVKAAVVAAALVAVVAVSAVALRPALGRAFYYHTGHLRSPGISYQYLPDVFLEHGHIAWWIEHGTIGPATMGWLGKAVLHYLLEPLPRRIDTWVELFAYPQMMAWYACLPLALWGMLVGLRVRMKDSLPLVFLIVVWVCSVSPLGGNIGTAFRMRDMITPVILLFACVGAWSLLRGERAVAARSAS
jgi:hypothetical protein